MTATATAGRAVVPVALPRDTARAIADVLLPLVGRGLVIRRPRVMGVAERLDLDQRAVKRMRQLRRDYGPGPLQLRLPGRSLALVLSSQDVRRVLDHSPEPFVVASLEKRRALAQFQPHGLLVSHGTARADRRPFNEAVLDYRRPVHRLGERFVAVVEDEVAQILRQAAPVGLLTWDRFAQGWWRVVRRVVLGDGARDDHAVTDMLARLRAAANWGYARPPRTVLRARFLRRVEAYVGRAEAGGLAAVVATTPATSRTVPVQQIPQWLFAFDAAGLASFRALAMLDLHADAARRARAEAGSADSGGPALLPWLRACVLESLRLWPTTPGILRDTTVDTTWDGAVLPAGSALLIYVPFFHRDEQVPGADRFTPQRWLHDGAAQDWPLVPFSAGPAACPGRDLVLLTTSAMLAALLRAHELRLDPGRHVDAERLPGTFDPFTLSFLVAPRAGGSDAPPSTRQMGHDH